MVALHLRRSVRNRMRGYTYPKHKLEKRREGAARHARGRVMELESPF